MSNVNLLTLELSQPTDSSVLSGNSADRKKEGSTLFSTVMEQHKEQAQNGKSTKKDGNIEHRSEYRQSEEEISSKNNDDIEVQESNRKSEEADSVLAKLKENQPEQSSKVENEDNTQNKITSQNKVNDNAEDLLLFLNAAENTLVQSDEVSNKHVILTEALIENKKELEIQKGIVNGKDHNNIVDTENSKVDTIINHSKASKENVITDAEALVKKEVVDPKLDKTLIAQSISEQAIVDQKVLDKGSIQYQKLMLVENSKNEKQDVIDKFKAPDIIKDESEVLALKQKNALMNSLQEGEYSDLEKVSKEKLASYLSDEGNTKNKGSVSSEKTTEIETKLNNIKANKEIISNELLEQSVVDESKATDDTIIISNIVTDDKVIVKDNSVLEKSSVASNRVTAQSSPTNLTQNQQSNQDSKDASQHQAKNNDVEVDIVIDELSNNDELKPLTGNTTAKSEMNPLFDTLSQHEVNKASQQENRFIQNELSFENVMQNISADAVQTNKNTLIQQAETISIMRKDFTDAVKDKVMVMINQKIQQIDIQLDPPELGSMQIRVNLQNEQAVVSFIVQNQQAKEALEQNMDKLKHMMSESGVDVGEANVKQQSSQSSMQDQQNEHSNGSFEEGEDDSNEQFISSEHAKVIKASSTGVDYYA